VPSSAPGGGSRRELALAGRVRLAAEALPELAALLADGRLTVPVWRAYPLAEAAQAHADLEAGRNHGKIVLLP
jgi:NADPH:quinone reductase-like Zn-dependent oxidoreductase